MKVHIHVYTVCEYRYMSMCVYLYACYTCTSIDVAEKVLCVHVCSMWVQHVHVHVHVMYLYLCMYRCDQNVHMYFKGYGVRSSCMYV